MKYKYHKKTYGILAFLVVLFICATSCNRETNNNAAPGSDKGGSGGSNYWNSSEICKENPQAATAGTNISVTYSGFDEDTSVTNEACQIKFDGNNADISGAGAEIIKGECVTVKIAEAGTYVISGSTDNGQLYVEAGENQVHLVLNGATINCKKSAPIYINNGKKTVITLANNTVNTLTDEDSYEYSVTEVDETTGETTGEPNAALFSKKALTINGEGTLNVTANFNNGIGCKDELKIISGKINVAAVNNAIRGNDCVVIKGGEINASSKSGDGIKSTKENNDQKGYVYVEGGNVNVTAYEDGLQAVTLLAVAGGDVSISAGDDGMHCDKILAVCGGTINITKSYEGIEATVINISGGKTCVRSSDDGLNATVGNNESSSNDRFGGFGGGGGGMQYQEACQVNISGGYLYVDADGDGLDSNGDLTISGGAAIVNGPTNGGNGSLDANGTIYANGGFLVTAGSNGMAEYPTGASTQNVIIITFNGMQQAETIIRIVDENGADLLNFAPSKTYSSVIFSSPDIKSGSTYTVYTGGEYSGGDKSDGLMANGSYSGGTTEGEVSVSQILSYIGDKGMGGGFGDGGRNPGMKPDMGPGEMGGGQRPDKKPGRW